MLEKLTEHNREIRLVPIHKSIICAVYLLALLSPYNIITLPVSLCSNNIC
jgi:hypothetical protein